MSSSKGIVATITDQKNSLVIYFQELEYTIHAEGIPQFTIPYSRIKNLIDVDGPISKLTQRNI